MVLNLSKIDMKYCLCDYVEKSLLNKVYVGSSDWDEDFSSASNENVIYDAGGNSFPHDQADPRGGVITGLKLHANEYHTEPWVYTRLWIRTRQDVEVAIDIHNEETIEVKDQVPRSQIDNAIEHMEREGNASVVDEQGGWWYAYVINIKEEVHTELYFCTDPGVMRWNPSFGVALASGGYFMSEESLKKAVREACPIYKDIEPEIDCINDTILFFKQIETAVGLSALRELHSE